VAAHRLDAIAATAVPSGRDAIPLPWTEATGQPGLTWRRSWQEEQASSSPDSLPVMPFARRPRLSVTEDLDRVRSRVEETSEGDLPHIRLLVANEKRRRAAQGTRVLVEWYQAREGERVSLAHPSLGWPSAPEAEATGSVVVFAGGIGR
jgi:hypothetical protein